MKVTYTIESAALMATIGRNHSVSITIDPGKDEAKAILVLCRIFEQELTRAIGLESPTPDA
jgi:hypothetical protein